MSNSHVALSLLEQVNMLYNRVSPSIESCASRFRNNFYKVSMRANYVLLAPTTAVAAALLLRDALKMSRSSLSAMQLYITAATEPKRKEKCGDFSTVQLVSFYLHRSGELAEARQRTLLRFYQNSSSWISLVNMK